MPESSPKKRLQPEPSRSAPRPSPAELAEWEAKLAANQDPTRPTIAHAEEQLGVQFGAEGAEDVTWGWPDVIDQQIADKLATEGPDHVYMGSALNYVELWHGVDAVYQDLLRTEQPDDIKIGVHTSCMTGHDCVVVATSKGKKYHFNTRLAADYSFDRLAKAADEHLGIGVRVKP